MDTKKQQIKVKIIMIIVVLLLGTSIGLKTVHAFDDKGFSIEYEYINIKDIAPVKVAKKEKEEDMSSLTSLLLTNVSLSSDEKNIPNEKVQEVEFVGTRKIEEVKQENKRKWYFPTELGTVSQYPSYGHAAYDIISPRGSNEFIFPVANGTISGIYTDNAGALIVTVYHEIDGKQYTSLYAHLSSYADGLYVGKPVTINDCLGRMGSSGYSTGVHLHLTVLDCALFNPNDPYCSDLGGFFRYANTRVAQGYYGLGVHLYVPGSWSNR